MLCYLGTWTTAPCDEHKMNPPLQSSPVRIAMWSGPRNISTAMMRAWENRHDTTVIDEPFYAHYLQATGLDHPGRDEVVAAYPTDWRAVAEQLTGPEPDGRPIYYQKHMTHHMLPGMTEDWLDRVHNVFLIREPAQVIASYVRKRQAITLEDTGLPRQWALFETVRTRTGETPLVIDAADVLADPPGALRRLCAELQIAFDERMLNWPAGPRPTDGIWAKYWYHAVEQSTRFHRPEPVAPDLPESLLPLVEECSDYYRRLRNFCQTW